MSTEPAQSRLGLVGSTVMTLAYQPMLYKVCEAEQMGELSTEVLSRIELVLSVITTQDPESPFDSDDVGIPTDAVQGLRGRTNGRTQHRSVEQNRIGVVGHHHPGSRVAVRHRAVNRLESVLIPQVVRAVTGCDGVNRGLLRRSDGQRSA